MQHYKNEEHFEGKDLLKIQYDTHNADREHTHDFVELVYVTKGEVIHRVDNEFYKIRRGGLVFINIGQVHSFFSHGNVEFVNITLKSDFFQERGIDDFFEYIKAQDLRVDAEKFKQCVQFNDEECVPFETIISLMYDEYTNKKENYNEVILSMLKTAVLILIRKMLEQQLSPASISLKEFIDMRCFDNININTIAEFFGYNPAYLSRKFKEENNQTITSYIKENRAKAAIIMLESTDFKIESIANIVGYSDVKQIYKLVKKIYGCTPNEIRKKSLIEKGQGKVSC